MQVSEPIDRAEAFGRIAFSCPSSEVSPASDTVTLQELAYNYVAACWDRAVCQRRWTHCPHPISEFGHSREGSGAGGDLVRPGKCSPPSYLLSFSPYTAPLPIISCQDGHEICFVGDEAFRELSQVDPKADQLLTDVRAIDCSYVYK